MVEEKKGGGGKGRKGIGVVDFAVRRGRKGKNSI